MGHFVLLSVDVSGSFLASVAGEVRLVMGSLRASMLLCVLMFLEVGPARYLCGDRFGITLYVGPGFGFVLWLA